jgi:hypothetical protein
MLQISPSQNLQIKQRKIIINFYAKQENFHLNFYVFIEFFYYGFLFDSLSAAKTSFTSDKKTKDSY